MYSVQTHGYCGMTLSHGEFEELEEAQERIQKRLKYLEAQGCEITRLDAYKWEVGEPEDCWMVPDFCGYLVITRRGRMR